MNTVITKTTSKGQITLPAVWRKNFKTDRFILTFDENTLKIKPIDLKKVAKRNDDIIFNSVRDNKGIGLEAKELLKILKKIDG